MDCRERVLKALELGEPDRVPSFFESVMSNFSKRWHDKYDDEINDEDVVIGNFGDLTFYKKIGVDSCWLHSSPIKMKPFSIDLDKIDVGPDSHVSRTGSIGKHGYYRGGYLTTEELWKQWIEAGYFDYEIDNSWIRHWEKAYPEALKGGVMLVPVDVTWERIREGMGMATWARLCRKNLSFIKKLLQSLYRMYDESAKAIADAGFDVCTWADDAAYKENTMISPQLWEDLIVPHYTRLNGLSHKGGMLTFYHSDGYTAPFFPGLIKSGFNGIQSLEPAAGMNLKELKEKYGHQVCLIGNIDVSRLLPFGTESEVITTVKDCIKNAGKGGGYIFGPCTDIIDSCKPENVNLMMETLLKFGKYPLHL
jgi:hypothetical protein